MGDENLTSKQTTVLADHVRRGRRLIPPMAAQLPLGEARWFHKLPELVWCAVLADRFGWEEGVQLSERLVAAIHEIRNLNRQHFYLRLTEFSYLTDGHWEEIRATITDAGLLAKYQEGFGGFVSLYPECPLRPLVIEGAPTGATDELDRFKRLMGSLMDGRGKQATMLLTTATHLAFQTGKLKLVKGVELGNLNAVLEYPDTEESRKVAASMRAMSSLITGLSAEGAGPSRWCRYFWNRGLELGRCDLQSAEAGRIP